MDSIKCLFVFCCLVSPAVQQAATDAAESPSAPDCYSESADCRLYGDCCDYVPDRLSAMFQGLECVKARSIGVLPAADSKEDDLVWVVQTCPDENHHDAKSCKSSQPPPRSIFDPRQFPAMSTDGLLFPSTHCARCNGRNRLLPPRVSVECDLSKFTLNVTERTARNLRQELLSGRDLPYGCWVVSKFDGKPVHRCKWNVNEKCQNKSAEIEAMRNCENGGLNLVDDFCGLFRNPACLDCLGECEPVAVFNFDSRPPSLLSNVLDIWIPLNEVQTMMSESDRLTPMADSAGNWSTGDANFSATARKSEVAEEADPIPQVVLMVTYSLSILSLALLLVIYTLLPKLRNRAGQLLMSHAASVLALQAAQLINLCAGSLLGSACAPLQFIFYFCLVSAFVWAFLFGWDLLRTFASLLRNSAFKPSRYGRFALIGWGVPLVLTGILVSLHMSMGLLDVDKNCKFRPNRVAVMVGLSFTPLLTVLLFNLTIVCLLAVQLVKTYRETRSAGQSSASKLCIMTAKVSVIMGISWLPYFLITLTGGSFVVVLNFVGELLSSLHGLLLAVGFTGNRRVRDQVSKMTSLAMKTSSRSDTVSASRLAARRSQNLPRSQGPLLQQVRESADS